MSFAGQWSPSTLSKMDSREALPSDERCVYFSLTSGAVLYAQVLGVDMDLRGV